MIRGIRFVWKTITKSLVYFFFASGALFLITAVFPPILLFVHPAERCGKALRLSTHLTFKLMLAVTWAFGLIKIHVGKEDRRKLRALKSAIVVANHPSLLDVTILMSILPQADCIVNARLFERPIVRHVVRRLFVPNSLDFSEILSACGQSLKDGNCLVIFPEGSRTKPGIEPVIKKGSARISLGTGYPVVPVRIGANDMRGLRKGDPFYRINEKGRYTYHLAVGDPLDPSVYMDDQLPVAAKRMTKDNYSSLFTRTSTPSA